VKNLSNIPGYAGKILTVDLTKKKVSIEELPLGLVKGYIGGKGFAARILYDNIAAGCDPLSPDNVVVLAVGPLTGTLAPTGCRSIMATKSPLTNIWLDSNCGGVFGPEMKAAGFDLILIKGRSEKPVNLIIQDNDVSIVAAESYWGLDTLSVSDKLKKHYGDDYKVACIGQAGEKMVLISSVQAEGRSFGRGGIGAVFGSKNLKAIAIRGTGSITISNYEEFIKECKEAYNEIAINTDTGGARNKYGTSSIYSSIKEAGVLPIRNFQGGSYQGLAEIDEHSLKRELYEQDRACFACPIACSKYSKVKRGPYKGKHVEGPEFENFWSFGAQCGNSELGSIVYAEYLSDFYGIDAISTGNVIGFVMECYEKGIITKDLLGFEAGFGNHEALIRLVELIGEKKGFGEIIGQGVKRLAEHIGSGSDFFAMHVKGLELPAYDPRGAVGMGLAYATSDRGGCHLRAWPVGAEVLAHSGRIDPREAEFKAELVKTDQDWFNVVNSLGLCLFSTYALGHNQLTDLVSALTGIEEFRSGAKLLKIGEKIYNLTRLFNIREGITALDDKLPPRLMEETLTQGPAKGVKIPLKAMLEDYYLVRGWDDNGFPTSEKLRQLDLNDESKN
jgi:aldehyde:ferredoxin oxidoreductase